MFLVAMFGIQNAMSYAIGDKQLDHFKPSKDEYNGKRFTLE